VSGARQIKTALDETRMLVIGAQVLLGFQFNAVFQEGFGELLEASRVLHLLALGLLGVLIGFLIVPTMHHRLVEGGQATGRMQRLATRMSAWALALLAAALGLDLFIVVQRPMGLMAAIAMGAVFTLAALVGWFGPEYLWRRRNAMPEKPEKHEDTPLDQKIEQMLTEARVVLPGVQAMLGFDLLVTFTHAFEQLSAASKAVHIAALACAALTMILLIAPAAFHRITFSGQNTEEMHRIGSFLVTSAPIPLGLSIGANAYVAAVKITDSAAVAAALAAALGIVLFGLWYVRPLMVRRAVAD
jgi:Family of unknown function (DUF6328)